jgi:uncharacterized RDD family membrane protein YckC
LTIPTPEGVEIDLVLAGAASRFVSALVDILIQFALLGCVAVVLGLLGSAGLGGGGVALLLWFIISFGVIAFYDIFFEVFRSGQTPGKRMNRLRVVRVEGQPVSFLTSAVRNILRPIDFLPSAYLFGAVLILSTRKNQRIGDIVAGTLVVRTEPRVHEGSGGLRLSYAVEQGGAWDTSRVSNEEIAIVRQFLDRRLELEASIRTQLAGTLAERLRPKVTGASAELRGEQFLHALVANKLGRQR